jgi:hypothetical protein
VHAEARDLLADVPLQDQGGEERKVHVFQGLQEAQSFFFIAVPSQV